MDYKLFKELVKAETERSAGSGSRATFRSGSGDSGVDEISVSIVRSGKIYTSVVDMRFIYEFYLKSGCSIQKIADCLTDFVCCAYDGDGSGIIDSGIFDDILDLNKVSGRIFISLMNRELNQEELHDLPSVSFLDMEATFFVSLYAGGNMEAVIRITNDIIARWEVDEDELFEIGLRNMKEQGDFRIREIGEVINTMIFSERAGINSVDDFDMFDKLKTQDFDEDTDILGLYVGDNNINMYPVFDRTMRNGSAVMLLPEVLSGFSDIIGGDLIILPSSVNEVILVKDTGEENYEGYKKIVREVNKIVRRPEVLSYSVYKYSKDDGKVRVAA